MYECGSGTAARKTAPVVALIVLGFVLCAAGALLARALGEAAEQAGRGAVAHRGLVGRPGRAHVAYRVLQRALADRRDRDLRLAHGRGELVGEVHVDLGHGVSLGVWPGYVKAPRRYEQSQKTSS